MKKAAFYFSVILGISLAVYAYALVFNDITEFQLLLYSLEALFLLIFGLYGLYAEKLWDRFRLQGKTDNLCVEASYHIRNMGFFARMLLFPFLKIKSSNSFVISFLGAIAWVIIVAVMLKAFVG
jgi:hypothetical protein